MHNVRDWQVLWWMPVQQVATESRNEFVFLLNGNSPLNVNDLVE